MKQDFSYSNNVDDDGNPAGGRVQGVGLQIEWQDGPLGRGDDRQEPNGAFVETVLDAVRKRIEFYQTAADGKFACYRNEQAILCIEAALAHQNARTQEREALEVEGTHEA